ncbi:hypothetical protein [Glutamicibacter arilaitensis]|uniref:hypothetical protein n=1 Tax=Glutamicibacter arilaitensis TaxID=256701 RepID=UPI003FD17D75
MNESTVNDANKTLDLFMDSFHMICGKDFWRSLRGSTQINMHSDVQLTLDTDGVVRMPKAPLSDADESIAAAYFRKFISGGDAVYLGKVLDAMSKLDIDTSHTREAKKTFDQLSEERWPLFVKDDVSIGTKIGIAFVRWDPVGREDPASCEKLWVSNQDVSEVTFNEGMFHAFIPGRNERKRAAIRTMSNSLRKVLSNVALAGTVYASIAIHYELRSHTRWQCNPANCVEEEILRSFEKSN